MYKRLFRWSIKSLFIAVALLTVACNLATEDKSLNEPEEIITPFSAGAEPDWTPMLDEINGVSFVYVPAGCFMMGSTNAQIDAVFEECEDTMGVGKCGSWFEDEQPSHEVCLSAFWMSQTEVTNDQYRACVEAGGCDRPADESCPEWNDPTRADYPVVCIDWYQAETYAQWVGGSLPTEAQWEYAARGPAGYVYPWGDQEPTCEMANIGLCEGKTSVGSYPDDVSWVGALDMTGNVREWVADWYSKNYYATLVPGVLDPVGPESGDYRVSRGGSFFDLWFFTHAAFRNGSNPTPPIYNKGFRVVTPTLPSL